jgi:O-methyltransferase
MEVITPNDLSTNQLYVELLKKALTRTFPEPTFSEIPKNTRTPLKALRYTCYRLVQGILRPCNLALVQRNRAPGETMMGMGALNNLHSCMERVLADQVPGDFVETGVWRGGGTIFIRGLLAAYGVMDRKVWVADSFEGLPKPSQQYRQDHDSKLWESEYLAVSVEQVKRNFQDYGLLDDQVCFLKGFFSDTMPRAPIDRIALLRLDGDMYESTIVVLENLYPKVSPGGYVIVDDYGMIPACNRAVEDYRKKQEITEPLEMIGYVDGNPLGAYWRVRG